MNIYLTIDLEKIGMFYVGQDSRNIPNYLGSGKLISKEIKTRGKDKFKKVILCECSSKSELNKMERFWIKEIDCIFPNGYNLSHGGGNGISNYKASTETKIKMSKSQRGRKHSEETIEKMKKAQKGNKNSLNVKQSKETIEKRINSFNNPEVKEKMKKPKSEEAKRNFKIAHNRPEVKEKMKKPKSEEHRKNIKEAANRPEVKEKKSIAIKKAINKPEIQEKIRNGRKMKNNNKLEIKDQIFEINNRL
jgi:hypothetical protein